MRRKQRINYLNYSVVVSLDLKVLDGILFTGPVSSNETRIYISGHVLRVVIRMNMVCSAGFLNMF